MGLPQKRVVFLIVTATLRGEDGITSVPQGNSTCGGPVPLESNCHHVEHNSRAGSGEGHVWRPKRRGRGKRNALGDV